MKKSLNFIFLISTLLFVSKPVLTIGQGCGTLNLQSAGTIQTVCSTLVVTMIHDQHNLPYLYVAHKELGLVVYDISTPASPFQISNIPTSQFDSLHVMNVEQDSIWLYLTLGNSFTNPQQAGMAIVDISNPGIPVLTDYYVVPGSSSGGGIVKVENDIAYLGAMQSGLVLLNVSNKYNIQPISQFIPSIAYPPVLNPNPNFYNARGMQVKDSLVYLCYDAGGIRIINCTNPLQPVETGRWCNPLMFTPFNLTRAYNNCILNDSLLYVTVDYCGLEVLNISDTSSISLRGWWNPYNCPNNNWFSSPVHSNELVYDAPCKRLFMSTGKSDMLVLDMSDHTQPDSCDFYGGVSNGTGTWGIGLWQNQIYLSYICAAIPFVSFQSFIDIITFNSCVTAQQNFNHINTINIFPQPASDFVNITFSNNLQANELQFINNMGQICDLIPVNSSDPLIYNTSKLKPGLYQLKLLNFGHPIAYGKLLLSNNSQR